MGFEMFVLKSQEVETQNISSLPEEIQIVPLGEFEDAYGRKFRVMEEDVRNMLNNMDEKMTDLVIDYEHQTLSGNEAPAAAWIKGLTDKAKEGLWAIVAWTERAKEYLKNKEYRYLSPVLLAQRKDADGYYRPEILHSAALTNTPQIDGMVPIINKLSVQRKEDGMLQKIRELLGLKPETDEAGAMLALTALKAKAEKPEVKEVLPKDICEVLGLGEGASLSEVKGTILALKQPSNMVTLQEFQALKKRLAEKERDELVALAMKEGKISAAQKEWADEYAIRDSEGFKVFIAKAPVVVPMGNLPVGKDQKGEGALDESTLLVAKMFGNKPEDVKKYMVP